MPNPTRIRRSQVALLLVDVVNPMDFAGGDRLLEAALHAAPNLRRLKQRSVASDIPVIYVNDNFDCWHLGFRELVDAFLQSSVPGLPLIERLKPDHARDYYILKPFHSGFFRTGLEVLLRRLGAETLILSGFATDICVLFTANDAYMRDFRIVVPADCVAAERRVDHAHALYQMERLLKADVTRADEVDLHGLAERGVTARSDSRDCGDLSLR